VTSQCPCGFATGDQLWFASHQAQHVLSGEDMSELSAAGLERARRDLRVSLSLAYADSLVRVVAAGRISAIDAELAVRAGRPNG